MKKFILILGIMPLFYLSIAQQRIDAPDFQKQDGKILYSTILITLDSSYTSDRLFDIASQFIIKYPAMFKIYANDKYNFKMIGFYKSWQYPVYNIKDAMSISGLFEIFIKQGSIFFIVRNFEYKFHSVYELSNSGGICRQEDNLENLLTCNLRNLYHNVIYKNLYTFNLDMKSVMFEFQNFFKLFGISFVEKLD